MSTLERVVQERGSRVKRILEIGRIRWIVKPVSGAFCETTFLLFMGQRVFFSGRPQRSGARGCVRFTLDGPAVRRSCQSRQNSYRNPIRTKRGG
jgi:hypothetical protein